MKKLMTMIAAVGMAFGLFADGFQTTGASFEPNGTYQGVTLTWDNNGFNQDYWPSLGESATFEGTYTFNKEIGYPTVFAKDHTQYLKIKTTLGTPAVMKIAENPVGVGNSGLYFDAMVNMTVFDYGEDSNPAIPDGTKIAAYLQLASDADNAATNFVVATAADKRYVCADADVSEGWHRITIKAIKNVCQEGKTAASAFKVFVDGVAVSCVAAKADFTADDLTPVAREYYESAQLFLSGVSGEAEIASVSFDGQGSVDDIVFTETIPFAAAGDAAKAQVIIAADAAGVVTGVSTNGVFADAVKEFPAIFDAPIQGGFVYIHASGAYCLTKLDAPADGGTLTVTKSMLTKAKATFDNTAYEMVALAVAEANKVTSGTHTLALIDDAEEDVLFQNASMGVNIVFDLAGKKLTGSFNNVMPMAAIVITNSTDEVGSIDGTVQGANLSIFGGKFLYSANPSGITATFPAGKKLVNDGATPAYWVLVNVYAITAVASPTEGGTVTVVPTTAAAGETVTVTATPAADYKLVKIMAGEDDITAAKEFTMPAEAVTVTATFEQEITDHNVTITWSDGEGARITAVSYTIDGQAGTPVNGTPFTVADGKTIIVTATTVDWWKCDPVEMTISKDETITLTPVAISDTEIDDPSKTAAEVAAAYGVTNAKFTGNKTLLKSVVTWATASATRTVADVNTMTFDEAGNPKSDTATAYLLNCDVNAIEATEATFKFSSIVPGEVPEVDENNFNGDVKYLGAEAVTGPWGEATKDSKFYKATLVFPAAE